MIVSGTFTDWWAYLLGPVVGAVIAAVAYDRFLAPASTPEPAPEAPDTQITGAATAGTAGAGTAGAGTSGAGTSGRPGEVDSRPDRSGDLPGSARA